MDNYIFSIEAMSAIYNECFKARGKETGGIFVSPYTCKNVITDVIPSSAYAERQAASYYQSEQDVNFLNTELRKFQRIGYDFTGYWHWHPAGINTLSQGDKNTCFNILNEPSYKVDNKLLMSIITETKDNSLPIYSYVVSLDQHDRVTVVKANVKILPIDCIDKFIRCFELKPLKPVKQKIVKQETEELNDENKNTCVRQYSKGIETIRTSKTVWH